MPQPVCFTCKREMTKVRPVVVQLNAFATNGAYQQWHGDLHECRDCGHRVVAGYGHYPSWQHFQDWGAEVPDVVVEERRQR